MRRRFAILGLVAYAAGIGFGQTAPRQPRYFAAHTVDPELRHVALAVGPRLQAPGRERLIMTGTLTRAGIQSALRVIRELPGLVRIDETGGRGQALAFDLDRITGRAAIESADEDLLESMEADTAEYLLQMFGRNATLRLLGHRFRVANQTGFGSEMDVYEMVAAVRVRGDAPVRTKHYMFDSRTGLLRRVGYKIAGDTQSTYIETVYSDYATVAGHPIAGKIVRVVNGAPAFTFTRESASVIPAANDNAFRLP